MTRYIYAIIVLMLVTCKREDIKAVVVTSGQSGRTYKVFYYKNFRVYEFKYMFDSSVNGDLKLSEWRPMIFITQKDSTYGYLHYPHKNPALKDGRYKADSMLLVNSFNNPRYNEVKQ